MSRRQRANEPPVVWVLVADEAIAHLYELPAEGGDLVPVEQLTDPAAHRNTVEQRRDALGRRAGDDQRMGGNATVSAGGEEQEDLEAGRFARQVAQLLMQRLQQKRYDELQIAAAPRFLGHLRKALDKQVAAALTRQIDKDLVHESAAALTARLFPERMPPPGGCLS
jgi:protein required for attachment to host cells